MGRHKSMDCEFVLGRSSIFSENHFILFYFTTSQTYAFIQTLLFCFGQTRLLSLPADFAGMRIPGQWRLVCGPLCVILFASSQNVAVHSLQCWVRNVAPSSAIHINSLHTHRVFCVEKAMFEFHAHCNMAGEHLLGVRIGLEL